MSETSAELKAVVAGPPKTLFLLIFAVSGFAGLIYESIWSHYLKLFLGHAAYAQSLVLIIFMGGMAIGSGLAARYSARWAAPILAYAVVEAVVGILALGFHGTFTTVVEYFYTSLLPSLDSTATGNFTKWSAAAVMILPQSILLGMTFPLLSAGIIRRYPQQPGGTLAMLYFSNSIGAAIGVLASGFWLIGMVGLPGTIMTAGLLNVGLALCVWVVVRMDRAPASTAAGGVAAGDGKPAIGRILLLAAFITGAASFIYEIAWIRMLSLVLGATTHSFELMLSAFIAGLAFGGLWIKRRIDRIESPLRFSAFIQIAMGACALLTLVVYAASFQWMSQLINALAKTDAGFSMFTVARSVISIAVMLPATFLAGTTLPLFTYMLLRRGSGEKAIGSIYAANTLGAIVGVVFAVHIGLPALGVKNLIGAGALLDIGLGIVLLLMVRDELRPRHAVAATTLVAMGLAVLFSTELSSGVMASGVYRHGSLDVAKSTEIIFYRDGKTASISVAVWPQGTRMLSTNGKPDAALRLDPGEDPASDAITMVMLGTLPLAYHPNATRVANIGMGAGLTSHALLASESVERLDTVEIESAVVAAARLFGPRVERVFEDSRSHIHIEDAKTYFSLHKSSYDIIVAEPSNPWVSGVASLFSTEFYRTVRRHIAPGGLFVQWLQLYEFDDDLAASILKALGENFEDYVIYNTDSVNVMIIASRDGRLPEPNFDALFRGELARELRMARVNSSHDLAVRRVATRRTAEAMFGPFEASANSDYFPYVDLNAGRVRFKASSAKSLTDIGGAELPALEMLHGDDFDLTQVTPDPTLLRAIRIEEARQTHDLALGESHAGDDALTLDVVRAHAALVFGAEQCFASLPAERWLSIFHALIAPTLAFLPATDAEPLVREMLSAECIAGQSPAFQQWMRLYAAIAIRDAELMARLARELLAGAATTGQGPRGAYLLGAGLLGEIAGDNGAAAMQLWATYSESVLASSESVGVELQLLANIASTMAAQH